MIPGKAFANPPTQKLVNPNFDKSNPKKQNIAVPQIILPHIIDIINERYM
jgi:hypothetical protein